MDLYWPIAACFAAYTAIMLFIGHRKSGWPALARCYRSQQRPTGTAFRFQGGVVGGLTFRNQLFVRIFPGGLFLRTFSIPFCPTLLLPWSSLVDYREFNFLGEFGECHVVTPEGKVLLCLRRAVWASAAPYLSAIPSAPPRTDIRWDSGRRPIVQKSAIPSPAGARVMKKQLALGLICVGGLFVAFFVFIVWQFVSTP